MANYGKRMVPEDQIKKLKGLADIREAGENITIENGVISADGGGSEYTAGTGIEITDQNVINNTAPAKTLYQHNIYIEDTNTDYNISTNATLTIINDSSQPLSFNNIVTYVSTTAANKMPACVAIVTTAANQNKNVGVASYLYKNTDTNDLRAYASLVFLATDSVGQGAQTVFKATSTTRTLIDNVAQL